MNKCLKIIIFFQTLNFTVKSVGDLAFINNKDSVLKEKALVQIFKNPTGNRQDCFKIWTNTTLIEKSREKMSSQQKKENGSTLKKVGPPSEIPKAFEWQGVDCFDCKIKLPPNNWNFDKEQGYYCFYEQADGGSIITYNLSSAAASVSKTIKKGTKLYKYFRRFSQMKHMCPLCFSKSEPNQNRLNLDKKLQSKGVIAIPKLQEHEKTKNQTTLTSKKYGLRLSGHPDGKVTFTKNKGFWEVWQCQKINQNQFFWKSKAHGTYLRAWPDGHLDLTKNRAAWETWTKNDYITSHTWKSCHGEFLSNRPDGTAYSVTDQLGNEFWLD